MGQLARRTTVSNVSPSDRSVTLRRISPLSRPTAPQTGGRSFSQVPGPGRASARRRGGSSGSRCGTPFFPRILGGLVGLQHRVIQRHDVAVADGPILEAVPQVQQSRAVASPLAGQSGGGDALGDAAEDQDQFAGPALDAVQGRAGEAVEDPMAVAAADVQDRVAAPTVNDQAIASMATGAGQAIGMQPVEELHIARMFIHKIGDREIHGGLRMGTMCVVSPKYPPPAPGCKLPTPIGLHEPLDNMFAGSERCGLFRWMRVPPG
jgi:hypothetical protein